MRIDQWVPALHRGDAIGDSARLMRDAFRAWGHAAEVYALDVDADLEDDGRRFSEWRPGGPEDVVILHFALPSPLTAALREHRGRRVLLHHNITPPEFFRGWDDELARICEIGRQELASLVGHVDLGLADSEFNRRELEALGFPRTGVLPIYLDFRRYRDVKPNPVFRRLLEDGRTNLLFVGRVVPNKRHDDLIRLASYWKKFVSPDLRLLLVGKPPRLPPYMDALRSLFYEEGFSPSEVTFTGHVAHDDLLAAYAAASVFVSMSEHEGFGVPLVESMLMRVPVVAYRCTAVGDTLGGAGLQFDPKRLPEMAEAAHLVTTDAELRARVLAGQDERLGAFAPAVIEGALRAYVDSLGDGGAARAGRGKGERATLSMPPARVAMVVQRYGREVTGGSESLCRAVAERLAAAGHAVTVFTTCATDYVTWRNRLAEGREDLGGVLVLRFPVEGERDLQAFNRFAEPLYRRATTRDEEREFLRRQGPYSPRLVEELKRRKDEFDAIFFFTYLYYPTVAGLEVAAERAVLVPTTHDEPPLRFAIYRELFERPQAFAFLTRAEEALVRERFDLRGRAAVVAGIGIETPEAPDVEGFRIRQRQHRPYALYAGRIDAGKGCDEMLSFYDRYRQTSPGGADLLLIGTLAMPTPRVPGARYLGYLSEEEKHAAMAGAKAVVCPSVYESLSIVLLEGFALGTPGLVNARSAVLQDHARRSNAGLYYANADEFAESLDLLVRSGEVRDALSNNGRAYVAEAYLWPAVLARYEELIAAVRPGAPRVPAAPLH